VEAKIASTCGSLRVSQYDSSSNMEVEHVKDSDAMKESRLFRGDGNRR